MRDFYKSISIFDIFWKNRKFAFGKNENPENAKILKMGGGFGWSSAGGAEKCGNPGTEIFVKVKNYTLAL